MNFPGYCKHGAQVDHCLKCVLDLPQGVWRTEVRWLYRGDQVMGMVDDPAVASTIAIAMNAVNFSKAERDMQALAEERARCIREVKAYGAEQDSLLEDVIDEIVERLAGLGDPE